MVIKLERDGQPQICQFDKARKRYFNCGPARIHAYRRICNYCIEKRALVAITIKAQLQAAFFSDDKAFGGSQKNKLTIMQRARLDG